MVVTKSEVTHHSVWSLSVSVARRFSFIYMLGIMYLPVIPRLTRGKRIVSSKPPWAIAYSETLSQNPYPKNHPGGRGRWVSMHVRPARATARPLVSENKIKNRIKLVPGIVCEQEDKSHVCTTYILWHTLSLVCCRLPVI